MNENIVNMEYSQPQFYNNVEYSDVRLNKLIFEGVLKNPKETIEENIENEDGTIASKVIIEKGWLENYSNDKKFAPNTLTSGVLLEENHDIKLNDFVTVTEVTVTKVEDGIETNNEIKKIHIGFSEEPENYVNQSFSENQGNATGNYSHAEGSGEASGDVSHAEGCYTQAKQLGSHAEGRSTTADGNYSHAEGDDSLAEGEASHAEGYNTLAKGNYSHAEGYRNRMVITIGANGDCSHVEGYTTQANGEASHAEGYETQADGNYSHAEGKDTQTGEGALASHAEGLGSMALGLYSHAEGFGELEEGESEVIYTQAKGKGSHAEGRSTIAEGDYSHTEGYRALAKGQGSHAEGYDTYAEKGFSHAEGYNTQTSGVASHAEGSNTWAEGGASHTEGSDTWAEGYSAHGEGGETYAYGLCSHAEGLATNSIGDYSHSEGKSSSTFKNLNNAGKISSHTPIETILDVWENEEVKFSLSKGIASHTEGENCLALQNYSHAEGNQTRAVGEASHAEGYSTLAEGNYSHTEGCRTHAYEQHSHAEGYSGEAIGFASHAEGESTTAYGRSSHAEGNNTYARNAASHAEGRNTYAYGSYSHAEGAASKRINSSVSSTNIIQKDWDSKKESEKFSVAFGDYSHSEGQNVLALGNSSHAEGNQTQSVGNYSHAEGYQTISNGEGSHAEGENTFAIGKGAHSEGCGIYELAIIKSGSRNVKEYELKDYLRDSNVIGRYVFCNGVFAQITNYDDTTKIITTSKTLSPNESISGINAYIIYGPIAAGEASHAEGYGTQAFGYLSHAAGNFTQADDYQYVIGKWNNWNYDDSAFIIGNGTSITSRANAFRVNYDGKVYAQSSSITTGADYAEYFEWQDSNTNFEDRRGYFVTLDGDKIKIAESNDYVLGIISSQPSIIGNGDENWCGRYIMDEFGAFITEDFKYEEDIQEEIIDEKTGEATTIIKTVVKTGKRYKQNPNYDPTLKYIQRADRSEWDAVGMLGVLSVRDDGTCQVNGYCTVADGGIATASETGYRVIKRVNDHIIKIIFK